MVDAAASSGMDPPAVRVAGAGGQGSARLLSKFEALRAQRARFEQALDRVESVVVTTSTAAPDGAALPPPLPADEGGASKARVPPLQGLSGVAAAAPDQPGTERSVYETPRGGAETPGKANPKEKETAVAKSHLANVASQPPDPQSQTPEKRSSKAAADSPSRPAKAAVESSPGPSGAGDVVGLPDPNEERTQETLIVARHALWQQNFVRIQNWLSSSEAISMDASQNQGYAEEAGYMAEPMD